MSKSTKIDSIYGVVHTGTGDINLVQNIERQIDFEGTKYDKIDINFVNSNPISTGISIMDAFHLGLNLMFVDFLFGKKIQTGKDDVSFFVEIFNKIVFEIFNIESIPYLLNRLSLNKSMFVDNGSSVENIISSINSDILRDFYMIGVLSAESILHEGACRIFDDFDPENESKMDRSHYVNELKHLLATYDLYEYYQKYYPKFSNENGKIIVQGSMKYLIVELIITMRESYAFITKDRTSTLRSSKVLELLSNTFKLGFDCRIKEISSDSFIRDLFGIDADDISTADSSFNDSLVSQFGFTETSCDGCERKIHHYLFRDIYKLAITTANQLIGEVFMFRMIDEQADVEDGGLEMFSDMKSGGYKKLLDAYRMYGLDDFLEQYFPDASNAKSEEEFMEKTTIFLPRMLSAVRSIII
jgi:hypothetical protein